VNPFRRRVSPALVLLLALGLDGACGAATGVVADRDATPPELGLETAAGGPIDPAIVEGRVVLYEFWATWCTPCHVQVEILKEIYPEARARGVEFVAVATGEDDDVVREFLADDPYPYPVLLDPEERAASALEVLGLPTLIVVDRDGRVVWRRTGLTDRAAIERALAAAETDAPAGDSA